ncbi:ubiquinol-cytochrome c reductase iron-sulfur subunit [Oricola nitratireducens]|jgi:ubiquinol-cytochrome c reductase iron-sulfur subunit|uniref:ubiquinol-cytochrome c reductase iron-sulfur subunit n=1 Tax=Oricola nitratireducens TaxID=2775868 RepID=UPI00186695DD|nr:ubiquinol-cytochrome c reductase iron-sulfur subunit [Oricola nitratireducens]
MTSDETTRRDFIYVATGMLGVVGVAGLAWPFIDQMRPDAAVRAAGQPVEIDVSSVEPGSAIIVTWRGKPYFVRRLTDAEITAASGVTVDQMKDPQPADQRIGGPADEAKKDWVVVAANCTHLGCIPKVVDSGADGWHCPCHGSVFDFTGRILHGPAPINLPQPPHVFASDTNLIIGTDTAGA